jgi:hypothetical protein
VTLRGAQPRHSFASWITVHTRMVRPASPPATKPMMTIANGCSACSCAAVGGVEVGLGVADADADADADTLEEVSRRRILGGR